MYISIAQRTFQTPKKVKWFYGYPEQEQLKKRLTVTFQALRGLQVIRHGTIGVLGEIAPTFFNLANNEQYASSLGLSFIHLTMEDFMREAKKVKKEEILNMKEEILASAQDCTKLPQKSLEAGAKVLVTMIKLTEQYNVSAWLPVAGRIFKIIFLLFLVFHLRCWQKLKEYLLHVKVILVVQFPY